MPETSPSVIRRLRGRATGLTVAGTALVLVVPVMAVAGQEAGAAPADPVSVLKYTAKERKEALAYWTPARIKGVGKSVDLGPTGPKAKPWKGTALKTVGRLFFVNSRGSDTWCSATAVKSANRSTVMTAAHCVRLGSSPFNTSSSMVFVPGYNKGKKPHGAFAVRTAATPRSWEKESTNDMSALVVDADKSGRRLTDVVGSQAGCVMPENGKAPSTALSLIVVECPSAHRLHAEHGEEFGRHRHREHALGLSVAARQVVVAEAIGGESGEGIDPTADVGEFGPGQGKEGEVIA